MDKENGNRKISIKGNTKRRYEEEGRSKKDNQDGKGRRNILGLCETIWDSGFARDMGGGTELNKKRKIVTKTIQMGMSRGKTRKEERKSYGGNNNRGEIMD
jgi:hypothetical protein